MVIPKRVDTSLIGRIEDLEKAFAAGAYLSAISLAHHSRYLRRSLVSKEKE